MNLKCNLKNLTQYGRQLLGNEFSQESHRALIKECLDGFERPARHESHDNADHLDRIGAILHTHGTEGILEDGLDIQYCNTGDTYALTIMYVDGALRIGDWGSIVEKSL